MSGGKLEGLDFDAFYDTDDYGVTATVLGETESGLFDDTLIEDEDRFGNYPTFRCLTRFDEGSDMMVTDSDGVETDYTIEAVQDMEFGEHLHVLKLAP
jgi:hypothetical protein